MTKISKLFIIVLCVLSFCACSVQRVSKLITQDIEPGMSKEVVVSLLGPPYKIAFPKDHSDSKTEVLYYKERLWIAQTHRLIESILTFKNEKLISIEQGEETNPGSTVLEVD